MGADFIMTMAPLPLFENKRYVQSFDSIRDEVRERIEADPDLRVLIADLLFHEEIGGADTDSDWMSSVLNIAGDYFDVMHSDPRDTQTISLPCDNGDMSLWHMVTGGMSWGDYPTESFEAIYFYHNTGLFNKPFEYRLAKD